MTTVENEVIPPATQHQPWGWWEAVTIHLAVLLVAFLIQWKLTIIGGLAVPVPWNWIIVGGLAGVAILLGAIFRQARWMRWLSGIPFAIVALTAVSVLSLLGTLIIQQPGETHGIAVLGFRQMFTSFPFLAMVMMMLLSLSTVLGRRLCTRKPGNLGFILNHAGLILIIVGMAAGSAQLVMARVQLHAGVPTSTVVDDADRSYELGATVTLDRFAMEWYPPQLRIASMGEAKPEEHQHRISSAHFAVQEGQAFNIEGVEGRVLRYFPSATFDHAQNQIVAAKYISGFSAAELEYTKADGEKATEWVVSGSSMRAPIFIPVDETRWLYMTVPAPKAYRSHLTVGTDQHARNMTLAVNQPIRVGKWQLYQSSYEANPMMETTDSILQAVRDPALPIVYLGFIFLLVGAFVTFWAPARRRDERED